MSAKLDFYDKVKERLFGQVQTIKTVQLFNNQFENEAREEAFAYPAVMIHFLALPWVSKTEGIQQSEAVIRLHIAFESLKYEEREIFTLIDEIHQALNGFSEPNLFGAMARVNEEQDIDHDNLIIWLVDYSVLISDTSGYTGRDLVRKDGVGIKIVADPEAPYLLHKP